MPLLVRRLLWSPFIAFFAATLLIAGCSKSSTDAGLEKEDLDGDGIANMYDPDIDGDGIPNGSDPDIDGDGIPNDKDNDIDGDGKPNGKDPDMDGDGIANGSDPDIDGDGKPNGKDPSPGTNTPNYCDQIQVFGLNEEDSTGSIISISWQLQSSKTGGFCVVKDDVKVGLVRVRASAAGAKSTTSEQTNPVINTRTTIRIPAACTGETAEVTYDFTEIADLIKADPNAPGWTVKQRHRADPERCDIDGDGSPDWGGGNLGVCPSNATGTYPACTCPAGEEYDGATNSCVGPLCPTGATGTYPNCSCPKGSQGGGIHGGSPGSIYNAETNSCDVVFCTDGLVQVSLQTQTSTSPMYFSFDSWYSKESGTSKHCAATEDQLNSIVTLAWQVRGVPGSGGSFELPLREIGPNTTDITEQYCQTQTDGEGVKYQQSGEFLNNVNYEKVPNYECPSADTASDTDNDGIPNDSDSDVDGDGIPNTSDKDIDGDGTPNDQDPDIDGDGKTNGIDPDADGDGIPDAEDDTPGGPQ